MLQFACSSFELHEFVCEAEEFSWKVTDDLRDVCVELVVSMDEDWSEHIELKCSSPEYERNEALASASSSAASPAFDGCRKKHCRGNCEPEALR